MRRLPFWLFALFFILIITVGALSVLSLRLLEKTEREVDRTNRIFLELEELISDSKNIYIATRDYVISGDSSVLEGIHKSRLAIEQGVDTLRTLMTDSIALQHLGELKVLIDRKLETFNRPLIELRQTRGFAAAREFFVAQMDQELISVLIPELIRRIKTREQELLRVRTELSRRNADRTILIIIGGTLVSIAMVATALIIISNAFKRRKLHEHQIRKLSDSMAVQNEELNAILDSALVCIMEADTKGHITKWNRGAEILTGYSSREVTGAPTPDLMLHDEVRLRGHELSGLYGKRIKGFDVFVELARQGHHESREWTLVRKDGDTFPVQLVVTAIHDNQGRIRSFLGIATDISDLKKAKTDLGTLASQLQKQNSRLLNFAHITSHNLRSPVSNMNALLDFYKESRDEEDKKILFEKLETVLQHLTSTLNELTEALKIQEDTDREAETLSFQEIFNKTNEVLAGHIMETRAVVTTDFSEADKVVFPRSYMESIFLNLISNALKYRSPHRPLRIHCNTEVRNSNILLRVEDNGLGIDLEKYGSKLFGLNRTFHQHAESKGVGLFITKTQVEAMGGSISAESEVDKGTTFKVLFRRTPDSNGS